MKLKPFVSRSDRREVDLRGFALGPGRDCDIKISNLSYGGCEIRSMDELGEGEVVELRIIKLGTAEAQVCWTAEGRAGARFV